MATLDIVDDGTGTPKYLVFEKDLDPFVAQNIHDLIEGIDLTTATAYLTTATVYLLTPDTRSFEVLVHCPDHDDLTFEILLVEDDSLIERIEYDPEGPDERSFVSHTVHINGFPE